MQESLLNTINDICKDNGVTFRWRHDQVADIFHCIFIKGRDAIDFSINYYMMLFQPEWITIRDIKTSINKLCS